MADTYYKLIATKLTPHFREAADLVEEKVPRPGPGELLIRNRWAGVNATDVNITAGRYSADPELPMDLGAEAVGEVAAVGEGVEGFSEGDAVATGGIGGGYREYQVTKARHAIPVPEASPEVLSIFVSGLTASIALREVGRVGEGETVLVTAAAGGTGQYAVQLAKRAGSRVFGTCGSDEKVALLRDLGCDRPINYREEDVKRVLKAEAPDGLDLVYESVGRDLFDLALRQLAVKGRLLCIGYVSEYVDGVEAVRRPRIYTQLLGRSASVHGFFLPHYREHFREHTVELLGLVRSGGLEVAIDAAAFEGVRSVVDAVEYLHSGQSRGKVVVKL
jgi:NADPH-dependent curcumin reductase CurA